MLIREFIDIPRSEMPQIKEPDLKDYETEKGKISLDKIKPSQSERVPGKTAGVIDAIKNGDLTTDNKPMIVDRYGYLVNGHHRYDAYKKLGIKQVEVLVVRNATIHELKYKFKDLTSDEPAHE